MVAQLLRLVRDPELRQTISAHNRAVPSRVDWHEVVGMNVATYQRAIALMGARRSGAIAATG